MKQPLPLTSYVLIYLTAMTKVKCMEETIYFLGIYRSPKESAKSCINSLSNILDHIEAHNKPVVIMGDINIDDMKDTTENTLLKDELITHNIRRLLLPATRITHETATSIDFICTNLPDGNDQS
uniref:Endonuclease/exonuclease/phosphatase domain-containing protein n=1 Tax=Homalodisca liturata TaxID=320908 RepID=A0A1B6JZK0_9HEMI